MVLPSRPACGPRSAQPDPFHPVPAGQVADAATTADPPDPAAFVATTWQFDVPAAEAVRLIEPLLAGDSPTVLGLAPEQLSVALVGELLADQE